MMSLAAFVLLAGGWMVGLATASRPPLRSEHSEPAPPALGMVAVTEQGKLFHDPACPLIHGPAHLEFGRQAVAAGYTPCTRCLPAD